MSKARNTVISGLYTDGVLSISNFYRTIDNHVVKINYLKITTINSKDYKVDFAVINEQSIQSVEIINREGILTDYGSSIARGIAGGLLLGDAGLIAGAGMGKQSSINMLQITWKDGQKSLVEVDSIILSKLNIICWNIQNNIEGEQLTKEEILAQIEENKKKKKKAKGCLITILKISVIILAFACPYLWGLILLYIIYKLVQRQIKSDDRQITDNMENSDNVCQNNFNKTLKFIFNFCLYFIGISFILTGISTVITLYVFTGILNIFLGILLLPIFRRDINNKFKPKFSEKINKNQNLTINQVNIYYGVTKFFIIGSLYFILLIVGIMLDSIISTKKPPTIEQAKITQKVEQEVKKETPAPVPVPKPNTSNKPVKSENNYYSVANTLENYYKNYFNGDNWYVNSVIPADRTIHVSMIVVDPTWQENIKKYSSSRQYMVNCACPNSYTDIWHKIKKSDVSVTIYDVFGKRIGGGVCTN